MIFFLSYFVLASALEYPPWGDYQYGAGMMTYNQLFPQPECASTSECASLIGNSFNGWELDLCLKSANRDCTFIAEPNTYSIENVYLTYRPWEENNKELVPPTWATGCNASITGGSIYAASIQRFQDYFNTIPTDNLEIKEGYFKLKMNNRQDDGEYDQFDLYLSQDLFSGCSNMNFNGMTKLTRELVFDEWYPAMRIPFEDLIGKGSMLISHYQRADQELYMEEMRFESKRFVAHFKGANSANSIISLSLLSMAAFATF